LAQPENLYVIGTLMGLSPAALEHANVLEIGCASGGNLFAHALHYPESRITGFDLHPGEIEAARAHSERLGVTSITWRTGDAADAAMYEGGPYDYIICHGLYSWIPEASAADMMAHIQASLSPNGIAYVSYNTMPGWAVPETVAHMMRYHVEAFPKEERAIEQAFSLLSFVRDGVGAKQSPYAKMLESEWNLMTERPLSYMEQEYFSDHRRALYFHEFMEKAEREGFEYLADSYLPSMYVGRMPQEVQPLLIQMGANIIRTEQYMDFMTNRRFRTSLLVKKGQKIERSIAPQLVNRFHVALSFGLSSSMGMDAQMKLDAPISIMKESQIYYESHDPLVRLFLHLLLQKAPTAFAMECLIDEAAEVIDRADNRAGQAMICEGYEGEKNRQVLSERLCHIALELLLFGVITWHYYLIFPPILSRAFGPLRVIKRLFQNG
jgi:SAM-dependent methyltransferase